MQITFLASIRRLSLTLVALCLLLAGMATTAHAAPGHYPAGSVALSVTGGLGVNQSSGNVYVVDSAGISEISSGTPATFASGAFSGLAVDGTGGNVYAIDPASSAVSVWDSAGNPLSPLNQSLVPTSFFNPTAVAVAPGTGEVYVANVDPAFTVPTVIEVFNNDGTYNTTIAGPPELPFFFPTGLAVDTASHLYVIDNGGLNRYSTAGAFEATLPSSGPSSVAVDPSDNDVFAVDSDPSTGAPQVTNFDSSGAVIFRFGSGVIFGSTGIGVDAADRVWVADPSSGGVQFFDPAIAPDVTTGDATPGSDSADLAGTVDPLGQPTTYVFQWGTDPFSLNTTDPPGDAGSGTGPQPAAASISGLSPNTNYIFRLVAKNDLVSNFGNFVSFKTNPIPPLVTTGAAESVKISTAKINATVNPNNSDTTYFFEYGPTTAYGQQAPIGGSLLSASIGDVPVSESLKGLQPSTTYHYRISANNGTGGDIVGADQTFTTLEPLADASPGVPTDVTKTSATLHGTIDTHGFNATYFFSVKGTDNAYVGSTPASSLAGSSGAQSVSAAIGDLPIGSGLEVRVVVITSGGTFVSAPLGFRTVESVFTPIAPPPPNSAPYGCASPHLNAYSAKARPGSTITLTGSDLGVGGVVSFGAALAETDTWAANAIRVIVPSDARGSAAVKVDCAHESNAIKVGIGAAKKKATKCKRGYAKKKVKGKTRCVKKKATKGKKGKAKGRKGRP